MMNVKFIKEGVSWPLTIGRTYHVLEKRLGEVTIVDDNGSTDTYNMGHFEPAGKNDGVKDVQYAMLVSALDVMDGLGYTHHTTAFAGALHFDKEEILKAHFPTYVRKHELEKIIAEATEELDSL